MTSGRFALLIGTLIAVTAIIGFAEPADTPKHSLTDFITFFKRTEIITMQEVLVRFSDAKLGPLLNVSALRSKKSTCFHRPP